MQSSRVPGPYIIIFVWVWVNPWWQGTLCLIIGPQFLCYNEMSLKNLCFCVSTSHNDKLRISYSIPLPFGDILLDRKPLEIVNIYFPMILSLSFREIFIDGSLPYTNGLWWFLNDCHTYSGYSNSYKLMTIWVTLNSFLLSSIITKFIFFLFLKTNKATHLPILMHMKTYDIRNHLIILLL